MKVLALSTSTHRGSAAVLENDQVLGVSDYADLGGHAERIFCAVNEALSAANVKIADLGLIVSDIGPGSFTGVRVGVASAKGLALGLGVPLVGVGSLEAMAEAAFATGLARPQDIVAALIDAKKQEFFLAAYDASGQVRLTPAHVAIAEAARLVGEELSRNHHENSGICLVGEAALLEPSLGALVQRSAQVDLPDAVAIGRIGWRRLASSPEGPGAFDPAVIEPSYVRPPDAKPMVQAGATVV
jgi:tRNA threonylcarbamoyladenosine biosynthesis protein TsaB